MRFDDGLTCVYGHIYERYTQNFFAFFIHCPVAQFIVKGAIEKDGVEEHLVLFKNLKIVKQ